MFFSNMILIDITDVCRDHETKIFKNHAIQSYILINKTFDFQIYIKRPWFIYSKFNAEFFLKNACSQLLMDSNFNGV